MATPAGLTPADQMAELETTPKRKNTEKSSGKEKQKGMVIKISWNKGKGGKKGKKMDKNRKAIQNAGKDSKVSKASRNNSLESIDEIENNIAAQRPSTKKLKQLSLDNFFTVKSKSESGFNVLEDATNAGCGEKLNNSGSPSSDICKDVSVSNIGGMYLQLNNDGIFSHEKNGDNTETLPKKSIRSKFKSLVSKRNKTNKEIGVLKSNVCSNEGFGGVKEIEEKDLETVSVATSRYSKRVPNDGLERGDSAVSNMTSVEAASEKLAKTALPVTNDKNSDQKDASSIDLHKKRLEELISKAMTTSKTPEEIAQYLHENGAVTKDSTSVIKGSEGNAIGGEVDNNRHLEILPFTSFDKQDIISTASTMTGNSASKVVISDSGAANDIPNNADDNQNIISTEVDNKVTISDTGAANDIVNNVDDDQSIKEDIDPMKDNSIKAEKVLESGKGDHSDCANNGETVKQVANLSTNAATVASFSPVEDSKSVALTAVSTKGETLKDLVYVDGEEVNVVSNDCTAGMVTTNAAKGGTDNEVLSPFCGPSKEESSGDEFVLKSHDNLEVLQYMGEHNSSSSGLYDDNAKGGTHAFTNNFSCGEIDPTGMTEEIMSDLKDVASNVEIGLKSSVKKLMCAFPSMNIAANSGVGMALDNPPNIRYVTSFERPLLKGISSDSSEGTDDTPQKSSPYVCGGGDAPSTMSWTDLQR